MKAFFKIFFLAGGIAFTLMLASTLVLHFAWPAYTIEKVIGGSIGCGLGSGLVNGVFAALETRQTG